MNGFEAISALYTNFIMCCSNTLHPKGERYFNKTCSTTSVLLFLNNLWMLHVISVSLSHVSFLA